MKPVLLLDCYQDEAGAVRHFAPWIDSVSWRHCRATYDHIPTDLSEYSGVVVTGSRACVGDDDPWIDAARDLLLTGLEADVPILGCCFGHQLLAYAVGGPDAVIATPVPEVGYATVQVVVEDELTSVLGNSFRAFVSHQDAVQPVGGIQILARTEACPVHALRVEGKRAWGLQFHVEYNTSEESRILEYRAGKHPELGLDPEALVANRPDSSLLARAVFDRFLSLL